LPDGNYPAIILTKKTRHNRDTVKISIFGMGYAGVVSAACLAEMGHFVVGVDTNPAKVELLNAGCAPITETSLNIMIERAVKRRRLEATSDGLKAVQASELSLICVGTPSRNDGSPDYSHLENVCREIGAALATKDSFHVVVVRSTVLPGTTRNLVVPLLERSSSRKAGVDFGVCSNPEFLRESTAVQDFMHPPLIVIGETDRRCGDLLLQLYAGLASPVIRCSMEIAETVKYAANAWHAIKVIYANEIGNFCKSIGIDSHLMMNIICQDTALNVSPAYMRPGFAFGGSCLPKDIQALIHYAHSLSVTMPLIESVLPSNLAQVERGIALIRSLGKKTVGFLGFSFKAGTDDLRESPLVQVIERLIAEGYDLRLYDKNVHVAQLMGANREYIAKHIPHIGQLMTDSMEAVLRESDVIVIGNNAPEFVQTAGQLRPEQHVVDFVRIKSIEQSHGNYHGICW
jgi:GDP-mannose 6-dehydrogenase